MNQGQIDNCRNHWLPALRSGKYVQGQCFLYLNLPELSKVEYCCLGVACQLYPDIDSVFPQWKTEVIISSKQVCDFYGILEGAELPFPAFGTIPGHIVRDAIDMPYSGDNPFWCVSLSHLNDSLQWSFWEIAKVIEAACRSWELENAYQETMKEK